jgi:hypothetical protein
MVVGTLSRSGQVHGGIESQEWGTFRRSAVTRPLHSELSDAGELLFRYFLFSYGRGQGGIDFHRVVHSMMAHKFLPGLPNFRYYYVVG